MSSAWRAIPFGGDPEAQHGTGGERGETDGSAGTQLRHLTKPGLNGDGGNLWLQVRGPQQRSWSFRYMIAGKLALWVSDMSTMFRLLKRAIKRTRHAG
jgi:hypothetical protein